MKPGSATVPMPGYDVRILRPDGSECDAGEEGSICVKLPLPPGTLPTLWGDDDRFVASYLSAYPGFYLSGDGGYFDEHGYLFVMDRPTTSSTWPDTVCPLARSRLKAGSSDDGLVDDLLTAVRDQIGAVASLRRVDVVAALLKTPSGKILRKTMRGIADGRPETPPSTIADVSMLEALMPVLQS